ncbi:MAG: transcriptional repressor [Planctomycetes bacterium]|nr:transcriptional repressor [Planctomycetota bacterium]
MKKAREIFIELLRKDGLRLTRQREALLNAVFSTHRHFSAEELYRDLEKDGHGVSIATIYRSLTLLVEGGLIQGLDVGNGRVLYEHTLGHQHHDHMVCMDCGKITEFVSPEIEELQDEAARAHKFKVTAHSLKLFGYCSNCSKKHPDARATPAPQTRSGS